MFEGLYTAIITPFREGRVDEDALRNLIRAQVAAGVDGIVPCGSTGESATMNHAEHERVIQITVEEASGKAKVIAGTGSNNTAEAVSLTRFAKDAGADAALLISPYYNKPTQAGHVAHYTTIADKTDFPLIVYNIPGRTGINMLPETIAEMSKHPKIVGVKEAAGSIDQVSQIVHACDDDFDVLSGDDSMTLPMMACGAKGVISVTSNLLPDRFLELVRAAASGDFATARSIHYELLPLMSTLFVESNPIPIKLAMSLVGHGTPEVRMPLTPITDGAREKLEAVLKDMGII